MTDAQRVTKGQHSDDAAVDRFAAAMKAKLAQKREQGRGGWDNPDECTVTYLAHLLVQHTLKGDPIDVGNFAMMLWNRGCQVELLRVAKATFQFLADANEKRDSLQRRVEELTEAVRFGTELLRGHRYNWEHEQGDEDAPHTGEDCRACEYEALLARFEAALASDSKEGR